MMNNILKKKNKQLTELRSLQNISQKDQKLYCNSDFKISTTNEKD